MELTCKHFIGDRPCKPYWDSKLYEQENFECSKNCKCYEQIGKRILIIKLDAVGDVIRSTPLAEGIKKHFPKSQLTWLVGEYSKPFLKNNPFIDRIITYTYENTNALLSETFDLLINLDKDKRATYLANKILAKEKKGYLLSIYGTPFPVNKGAKYHYEIALDNWGAKSRNTKYFEEMIFDITEIPFNNEKYFLSLDKEDIKFANSFKEKFKLIKKPIIGINTGCGPVYPYKKWHKEGIIKLINKLNKNNHVILFGGPDEIELNKEIKNKAVCIDAGTNNTLTQFAALLSLCDVVFTGDTMALHIAIAFDKPVVAVFGPTPANEINIRKGKKLVGKVPCLNCYNQFPCIMDEQGEPNCMQTITLEEVLDAINSCIK